MALPEDAPYPERRCAFCEGAGKLDKEHVFPRWIGRLFGLHKFRIQHTRTFLDEQGRSGGKAWPAAPFQIKVTAVCGECDSGWMSDLEDEAAPTLKPLIRGERQTLSEAEQATVALWATKTAMMAAFTHRERWHYFPDQFRWVYEQRSPPPHHQIWLAGRTQGVGEWPFLYRSAGLTIAPESLMDRVGTNGHRTTIGIGHLVMHIFGHPIHDGPVLDMGAETGRVLTPIWPVEGETEWPPLFAISPERLAGLTPEPGVRPVTRDQD